MCHNVMSVSHGHVCVMVLCLVHCDVSVTVACQCCVTIIIMSVSLYYVCVTMSCWCCITFISLCHVCDSGREVMVASSRVATSQLMANSSSPALTLRMWYGSGMPTPAISSTRSKVRFKVVSTVPSRCGQRSGFETCFSFLNLQAHLI